MLFRHRSLLSAALVVALVLSTMKSPDAFSIAPTTPTTTRFSSSSSPPPPPSSSRLFSSPDGTTANGDNNQKPDLVSQTTFKAAIKRIEDEIEAQYRAQKIAAGTATEEPTAEEREWLEERARQQREERDGVTLVGKLDVTLPIDTQPELDLTESVGPLVLVTSCWGRTAEATGIQEFDTLTKVSVNDPQQPFVAKTKGTTLEETAGALTAAAQHALALGKTEIELEVQRLIQGYYAPPE